MHKIGRFTGGVIGLLGLAASLVLLLVSMSMNYRFGFQLGRTPEDGYIYGAASAAADVLKALAPFLLFAAIRNRHWTQATAALLVWGVCTGYALTAALGHAALNRADVTAARAQKADWYGDLKQDRERLLQKAKWIPGARPPEAVAAEMGNFRAHKWWKSSSECASPRGRGMTRWCERYRKLASEYASAIEGKQVQAELAVISHKLEERREKGAVTEGDPQVLVLASLSGQDKAIIATGLIILVAILLEVGSGLGPYVSAAVMRGSQVAERRASMLTRWREARAARLAAQDVPEAQPEPCSHLQIHRLMERPANDRVPRSEPQIALVEATGEARALISEFWGERTMPCTGHSATEGSYYAHYAALCTERGIRPVSLAVFSRHSMRQAPTRTVLNGQTYYHHVAPAPAAMAA